MTIALDTPTRPPAAPSPALMPRQMPAHPAVDRYGMATHKVVLPPKPVVFCLDPDVAARVLAVCEAGDLDAATLDYLRAKIEFAAEKSA